MNNLGLRWSTALTFWFGGFFIGAGIMIIVMHGAYITVEQDKPLVNAKPVGLTSNNMVMPQPWDSGINAKLTYRQTATPTHVTNPVPQVKADIDARFARIDQRLNELTVAARKLAGMKQTWDLKMGEVGKH